MGNLFRVNNSVTRARRSKALTDNVADDIAASLATFLKAALSIREENEYRNRLTKAEEAAEYRKETVLHAFLVSVHSCLRG